MFLASVGADVISTLVALWTAISGWFVSTIQSLIPIFYNESGLTILGALAACGLGVGLILLLLNFTKGFFKWR